MLQSPLQGCSEHLLHHAVTHCCESSQKLPAVQMPRGQNTALITSQASYHCGLKPYFGDAVQIAGGNFSDVSLSSPLMAPPICALVAAASSRHVPSSLDGLTAPNYRGSMNLKACPSPSRPLHTACSSFYNVATFSDINPALRTPAKT